MEKPSITINGKTITPAPPKMKVWRLFLQEAEKNHEGESLEDFLQSQVNLLIEGFNRPDVLNSETVEDVELSDIVPTVKALFSWIQAETFAKLKDLPKN
jgi:hypothetical protein